MIFGQHDLGQRSPFPRINLILCRNVLIYFTSELQRRALQFFAFSLRNAGYLILGKSESTRPLDRYFTSHDQHLRIFRREGDSVALPQISPETIIPAIPHWHGQAGMYQRAGANVDTPNRENHQRRIAIERSEDLLFSLPVGVVKVDRNYDVQMINNSARTFLGIHGSAVGEDLLHLIRTVPLEPVRNGIDQAFRTREPVLVDGEWPAEVADGENRFLEVTCYSDDVDLEGTESSSVIIIVCNVTQKVLERRALSEGHVESRGENEQLRSRVEQLQRSDEQLLSANRELAATNEKLHSTYHQLLVANEESQAASEEIETLNEELQASNEELETLNEELQATVEELNATNEDMQARTIELQEMTVSLDEQRRTSEAQRASLEAVLDGMADALFVVHPDGELEPMNPDRCVQMFGDGFDDLRPENDRGEPLPPEDTPQSRDARGETFEIRFTVVDWDGGRRWFEAKSRTIQRLDEHGSSVLVIRDITDRSPRHLQEEFISIASHELRTPLTSLRGYLEMLKPHLPAENERSHRYLDTALAMVHRLVRLINEMLEVGRLQSGKFRLAAETTDLVPLFKQTVEMAKSMSRSHEILLELPEDPVIATFDQMRLQQVVLNLLSNAVNYSPRQDRVIVRLWSEREDYVFEVQDFGEGISEEIRPQIFSRFFQGGGAEDFANRGLGLGLFITRQIVLAHGGSIDVESVSGEGTTFTVRIPLHGHVADTV